MKGIHRLHRYHGVDKERALLQRVPQLEGAIVACDRARVALGQEGVPKEAPGRLAQRPPVRGFALAFTLVTLERLLCAVSPLHVCRQWLTARGSGAHGWPRVVEAPRRARRRAPCAAAQEAPPPFDVQGDETSFHAKQASK